MADSIEMLKQDPENARAHNPCNIDMIERALNEVGAARSVVVDEDNVLLCGNGVYEAAVQAGIKNVQIVEADGETIIAVKRVGLTPEQKRRLAYFDNRTAELAGWNIEQIVADLDAGLDLDGIFGDDELSDLLEGFADGLLGEEPPEPQIDKAEELREKWGVSTGDLWVIPSKKGDGEHRIICGDCTDAEVVERVMGGEKATLAPVDPPYNVGFGYDGKTVNDSKHGAEYEAFTRAWFAVCQSASDRQIVTPGCNNLASWLRWFDAYHWASWTKTNSMTNGKVSHFWCWEPVLFFGDGWKRKRPNDVFDFPIGEQGGVANHPCPKPLKMWCDLLENYSDAGDVVADFFLGSGTTLVAAERLGRFGRGIEISPAYVGVSLERLSDMGLQPERVGLSQGVSTGST